MQTNMTYDQFVTKAKDAGLYDQFSTADLNLARRNPDKGMQILNFKTDAKNATTPEQLALANQGAEDVRKSEGYSGGADGSGFYMTGEKPTAGSFGYTADSVFQAAKDGGVYDQLSPEDMQLIQNSPDYGMGVVSGKVEAANGNLEAGRNMAEQARMLGGGYTTNPDGTGYYKMLPTPADYTKPEAPTYTDKYAGEKEKLWNQQKNYGDFSYDVEKPTFQSQYSDEMQNLMSQILNRGDFSYNAENDPLYSQYRKQYLREGQRASADALGAAAAATGGIPSSYAATAAAQAGNYYAAQLTDKIPELYQLAYNQYLNDAQMDRTNLQLLGDMDDRDYNRYRDDVSQWNTDRNFAYNMYNDKYDRIGTNLETVRNLEGDERKKYLDTLDQYNKDNEFNYKQHTDDITHLADEREYKDGRGDTAFEQKYLLDELALKEREQTHTEEQDNKEFSLEERKQGHTEHVDNETIDLSKQELALQKDGQEFEQGYNTKLLESEQTQQTLDLLSEIGQVLYNNGKGDPTLLQDVYNKALEMYPNLATALPTPETLQTPTGAANGGTGPSGKEVVSGTENETTNVQTLKTIFPNGVITNMSDWEYVQGIVGGYDKMLEHGFVYNNPLTH